MRLAAVLKAQAENSLSGRLLSILYKEKPFVKARSRHGSLASVMEYHVLYD